MSTSELKIMGIGFVNHKDGRMLSLECEDQESAKIIRGHLFDNAKDLSIEILLSNKMTRYTIKITVGGLLFYRQSEASSLFVEELNKDVITHVGVCYPSGNDVNYLYPPLLLLKEKLIVLT
jgi:hypothetical protein